MPPAENSAVPPADRKPPAYAIFEGGGAKGITHVGALKALREKYWVVGAAGTSAGAIVAALTAVGYQADEIFDATKDTDILKENGSSPTLLLGRIPWWLMSNSVRALPGTLALAVWGIVIFLVLRWLDIAPGRRWWALFPILLTALTAAIPGLPVLTTGGVFRTKGMRDMLDSVLRKRLEEYYKQRGIERSIGEYVTFEDMSPRTVADTCSLRIIVTDAKNGRIMQFDERTGSASVADAVAASAALPLVFRPPTIRGFPDAEKSVFVDGGLVSNLPVWAFVSEKKMFERDSDGDAVPIFAFQLKQLAERTDRPANAQAPAGGFSSRLGAFLLRLIFFVWKLVWRWPRSISLKVILWLWASLLWLWPSDFNIYKHLADVVETGIFGSQTVVHDFVADLRIIEMESPLRTAEFGCSRAEATLAYEAGLERAADRLGGWREEELTIKRMLGDELVEVGTAILDHRQKRGDHRPIPNLRVCIVEKLSTGAFRVKASAGMAQDADDRMEYDPRNKGAPEAYRTKAATIVPYNSPAPWIGGFMTKYERALLPKSRSWIISVPVYRLVNGVVPDDIEAREVIRLLCLDSDDDLQTDYSDTNFMAWLAQETVVFSVV
jgi:NTE family protein